MLTSYTAESGDVPVIGWGGLYGFREGPLHETMRFLDAIVVYGGVAAIGVRAEIKCTTGRRPDYARVTFEFSDAPPRFGEMLERPCLERTTLPEGATFTLWAGGEKTEVDMAGAFVTSLSYGPGPLEFTLASQSLRLREQLPWPVRE